jgi:hypothetical protein
MNGQTHIRSHTHSHYFLRNNHTSALHSLRNDFGASSPLLLAESALTFRCKLCIPLGTTLELLRLLLLAESALTFRCKLCIPLGTTLELLRLLLFSTRWCALSFYIYIFGGFCSYRTKKGNYM